MLKFLINWAGNKAKEIMNSRAPDFMIGPKPAEPATTIFMTGPRMREWGFFCLQGWRHWKDFVSQENKGEQGVGCGEVGITDDYGIFNNFHCRKCGDGEIQLHSYDGYCRNCVEFSPYKRGPITWSVLAIWGCGISVSISIWVALIYWCLS